MDFDYGRFYVLGEGFTRSAIRVRAVDEVPDLFALTRGEVEPEKPLRFRWDEGSRLYDFVGTTLATLNIVSDRVIAVLSKGGFTGWATYPIEVRQEDGTPLHGYYVLAATGRCGSIEDELSSRTLAP